MRRVLTSFGFGPHAELLQIAAPGFARYAAAHDYDLFIPRSGFFGDKDRERPPSWWKLPLIHHLITQGYDAVLWIDADVVIRRFDKDIAEDCGDQPMHMVVHHTNDGAVPNCGVWYLRRDFLPVSARLWNRDGFRRSAGWWEQAAVIDFLGGDPDATPVSVPDGPLWGQLPYEWNPHVRDSRSLPAESRFFHATCFDDHRAAAMREVAAHAT